MIPKIIHYCWFGRGEKPKKVLRYIELWKKILPDYQIIEWNEESFDYSRHLYAKEAYEAHKYAFVSDVARLHALYTSGGIYLDTDVELLKSFDSFLQNSAFMGFETPSFVGSGIIGAEKGMDWVGQLLEDYKERHFVLEDGTPDLTTNVKYLTRFLLSRGLSADNSLQELPGIGTIYPNDYFSPLHPLTGRLKRTPNTVAIHHYLRSWNSSPSPVERFRRCYMFLFGENAYYRFRRLKLKLFPKPWK